MTLDGWSTDALPAGEVPIQRLVSWSRSPEPETYEHCMLTRTGACVTLAGTLLGSDAGVPVRVDYRVNTDRNGLSASTNVVYARGFERRSLTLERTPSGAWTVDGTEAEALDGCTDVDLGCTPATNTLPILRLGLAVGGSSAIRAAWVRFPDLSVDAATQTYQRLRDTTYRYSSGLFEADLGVDADGLVVDYDEWRRTSAISGP